MKGRSNSGYEPSLDGCQHLSRLAAQPASFGRGWSLRERPHDRRRRRAQRRDDFLHVRHGAARTLAGRVVGAVGDREQPRLGIYPTAGDYRLVFEVAQDFGAAVLRDPDNADLVALRTYCAPVERGRAVLESLAGQLDRPSEDPEGDQLLGAAAVTVGAPALAGRRRGSRRRPRPRGSPGPMAG